jgi:hypothetical protein
MRHIVFLAVLAVSAPLGASERVTVRETSRNSFIAILSAERELGIEEAQQQLLPAASRTCKGLIPVFGKYTFSSSKPAPAKPTEDAEFEFHQTFSCEEQAAAVPQAPPTVLSAEESAQLVEFVERETERALSNPDDSTQRAFHARFSPSLSAMLPLAQWVEQQASLHRQAGSVRGSPLLKVTTYTDPPNSPGPGTYVAVDFQVNYQRAPFRCGYVMWLRDQAGNISVLRLEDGVIAQKEVDDMTAEELAQTKQQFRCFAP